MSLKVNMFLTPEQVSRCLTLTWRTHNRIRKMGLGDDLSLPVAVVGGTGVGKTSAVKAFHSKINALYRAKKDMEVLWVKLILSLYEAPDVGGYTVPDVAGKRAIHLMQENLPFDTDQLAIIFADEFDRAEPDVQNAYLQILLGGDFHGHHLSPNAYNILALNGASDIYTTPLCEAARTRICTLFVGGRTADSIESYDAWAEEKGLPLFIRIFNRHVPFNREEPTYEELAQDTSRTRDMAAMVSLERKVVDEKSAFRTDDIYMPVIAGLIGMQSAAQFIQMEKIIEQGGVMPSDIFDDPQKAEIPSEVSYVYFLMESCIGALRDDKTKRAKRAEKCVIYGKRLRSEWQSVWKYRIGKEAPEVCVTNAYLNWSPQ